MNKFNKSIQQVIQFALTFFMAMFALISGLQLVYLVKNGVTTQGLIMVVLFCRRRLCLQPGKGEPEEEAGCSFVRAAQNAATEDRSLPRSTNTRLLSNSLSPAARPAPAVGIS